MISKYFDQAWWNGFYTNLVVLVFSQKFVVDPPYFSTTSSRNFHTHKACVIAEVNVIYYNLVEDKSSVDIFLELHMIKPYLSKKQFPLVDF